MKKSFSSRIGHSLRVLGILAFATASSTLIAGEDIAVAKLPNAVTKALMERFPKAELINAEKETDKGQMHYEVKIRTEGTMKEVNVSPEGKILKVENDK